MYSRGKISKGGELEMTVYESYHSPKLQDNPVSSETPVYANVLDRGIVLQS